MKYAIGGLLWALLAGCGRVEQRVGVQRQPWADLCGSFRLAVSAGDGREHQRSDARDFLRRVFPEMQRVSTRNVARFESRLEAWLVDKGLAADERLRYSASLILYGQGLERATVFAPGVAMAVTTLTATDSGTLLLASLLDSVWTDPSFRLDERIGVTNDVKDGMVELSWRVPTRAGASLTAGFCGTLASLGDTVSVAPSTVRVLQAARTVADSGAVARSQARLLVMLARGPQGRDRRLALLGLREAVEAGSEHYRAVAGEIRALESRLAQ